MYQPVTEGTLESTSKRALLMLRAISTKSEICRLMASAGYDNEEHKRGWELVGLVSGIPEAKLSDEDEEAQAARAAIAELDATDEPLFRRAHAALGRLHAEQDGFVFASLAPARGPGAVVTVSTFLDRLDALESSSARKATRRDDQAAIATLARRGIDAELRAHLRGLVEAAQRAELEEEPEPPAVATGERENALLELRAWYEDWAETARCVVPRRDHLILMGLAHRSYSARAGASDEVGAVGTVAAAEPAS